MSAGRWHGRSDSVERTMAIGGAVARLCQPGDVVALMGELGAGKTQFVRGMAQALGATRALVASPTFVMVHEYAAATGPTLLHVDAYRLRSLDDLESIGYDLTGNFGRGAIVVIEWADRLGELIGPDALEVRLAHVDESRRDVTLTARGRWSARFDALLAALTPRPCPICRKPVFPGEASAPFCSPRCRTIDLGRWIDGRYVISRPVEEGDLDEG